MSTRNLFNRYTVKNAQFCGSNSKRKDGLWAPFRKLGASASSRACSALPHSARPALQERRRCHRRIAGHRASRLVIVCPQSSKKTGTSRGVPGTGLRPNFRHGPWPLIMGRSFASRQGASEEIPSDKRQHRRQTSSNNSVRGSNLDRRLFCRTGPPGHEPGGQRNSMHLIVQTVT